MLPSLCLTTPTNLAARPVLKRSPVLDVKKRSSIAGGIQQLKTHRGTRFVLYTINQKSFSRVKRITRSSVVVKAASESQENDGSGPSVGAQGPKLTRTTTSGSVIGAIALITGSTCGAGMLALPEATAGGGFIPSAAIMIVSWLLLTSEALLLAEVNFSVKEKRNRAGKDSDNNGVVSLKDMAEASLGPVGGRLTTSLYLLLANTLLVAYISKAGELLDLLSGNAVSANLASLAFTLGLGGLLWKGSEKTLDFTNRSLTSTLLLLFGGLLLGGAQVADFPSLLQQQNWSQELGALPVVFLALVYHDLVPVICKSLNWNKTKIRTAIVCGSCVPLFMFLAWDAVALALVPGAVDVIEVGGKIDPVRILIETQGDLAGATIGIFSLLAICTAFIGGTMSLSEFMKAEFRKWFQGKKKERLEQLGINIDEKLAALILTLAVPSSIASVASPGLFFAATRIAGGYGMTLLYGILPPIMAWYIRHPTTEKSINNQDTKNWPVKKVFVPGGRPVLASLTSFAASIEIGKLMTDLKGLVAALGPASAPVAAAVNVVVADLASLEPTHLISKF
eukprot:g2413.t1